MLILVSVVGLAVLLLIAVAVRIDRSERRRGRGVNVSKIGASKNIAKENPHERGHAGPM